MLTLFTPLGSLSSDNHSYEIAANQQTVDIKIAGMIVHLASPLLGSFSHDQLTKFDIQIASIAGAYTITIDPNGPSLGSVVVDFSPLIANDDANFTSLLNEVVAFHSGMDADWQMYITPLAANIAANATAAATAVATTNATLAALITAGNTNSGNTVAAINANNAITGNILQATFETNSTLQGILNTLQNQGTGFASIMVFDNPTSTTLLGIYAAKDVVYINANSIFIKLDEVMIRISRKADAYIPLDMATISTEGFECNLEQYTIQQDTVVAHIIPTV